MKPHIFINKATIPNTLAKFTPQFSTAQLIPGSYKPKNKTARIVEEINMFAYSAIETHFIEE
jgi:hypothetical protein